MRFFEPGDILRIPEKHQKYRYAKISQLLEAGQFCRYVGDNTTLLIARSPLNIDKKSRVNFDPAF
jgi:hypothetical protein